MTQEKSVDRSEGHSVGKVQVFVDGLTVTLVRTFNASRERLFAAWTDPDRLARWFGPAGFEVPECVFEARPGSDYRIVMRSPQGQEMPLVGTVLEVDEPERLVLTQRSEGSDFGFVMTITFESVGGRTRMIHATEFGSLEDRDMSLKMGANNGWAQSFEKLEKQLDSSR